MTQLNCSVISCAHNKDRMCCLESIQVEGTNASVTDRTCCFSYEPLVDSVHPASATQPPGKATAVACTAAFCTFNRHETCAANEITIDSMEETRHCTQTRCQSFRAL